MSDAHLDHVESFSRYVFISDGRSLLTMRGLARKVWPSVWANSRHGHPTPGEALPEALSTSRTSRGERGLSARAEFRHTMDTGDITFVA